MGEEEGLQLVGMEDEEREVTDVDKIDEPRPLEEIVDEAEEVSEELSKLHREAAEDTQQSADLARSTKQVLVLVDYETLGPWYEENYSGWVSHLDNLNRAKANMDNYPWLMMGTSGSGTMILSSDTDSYIRTSHVTVPLELDQALRDQEEVIERAAKKEKAFELMEKFGLDETHIEGQLSPREQFETAYDALSRPVSGEDRIATTSLIPMRGAIDSALDNLLHQTSGATLTATDGPNKPYRKVAVISRELALDEVEESQRQKWAQDWVRLLDELSGGKKEAIERDELRRLVNKATLFVIGFLSGLDPNKLS